jgi:hypothetical protein
MLFVLFLLAIVHIGITSFCRRLLTFYILYNRYSFIEIPERIAMREVWAEINGTIIGLDDISVEN